MQYHQTNLALGSDISLSLVTGAGEAVANQLLTDCWHDIFQFERQFSRFLPGSELSQFNRNAGTKQLISPAFRAILLAAQTMGQATAGLYNPFILPALQAAGYDHSLVKGHEADAQDDHSHKSVVTIDRLEIGDDWARIPYGSALDLGGCGKGYLADQLAAMVEPLVDGYWLSLGGDIIAGGTDPAGQGWTIAIQRATGGGQTDIGTIQLPAGQRHAVATSGIIARHGTKAGQAWHHLIDPRTRTVAQTDVQLATVSHPSALWADVLASCAVIVGSDEALPFLQQQGSAAGLIQFSHKQAQPAERHFGDSIHLDGGPADTL